MLNSPHPTDAVEQMLNASLHAYDLEIDALKTARGPFEEDLIPALKVLQECRGKIIVSGLGKSGHIGRKIAATMSSLGSPAAFVQSGEALHGDSGEFAPGDVGILISNSGSTAEVCALGNMLHDWDIPFVAITKNAESPLAQFAASTIRLGIEREADPLNLAPTSSSTATLVIGDALAVGLMIAKSFTAEDFARRHPGGALGAQLTTDEEVLS